MDFLDLLIKFLSQPDQILSKLIEKYDNWIYAILFFLVFIGRIYYNFKYAKVDFFTESMIFLVASFVFYSIIRKSIPSMKRSMTAATDI